MIRPFVCAVVVEASHEASKLLIHESLLDMERQRHDFIKIFLGEFAIFLHEIEHGFFVAQKPIKRKMILYDLKIDLIFRETL